jgi:hypothetical protein
VTGKVAAGMNSKFEEKRAACFSNCELGWCVCLSVKQFRFWSQGV